ncbi:sensor histidine kinase [Colwellia demingiae]|uniref:Sensor histidine kinase n=2 Tax=Colwellia demingiae TaxID=89401 RepID=A0A5C6Q5Y7_9GAMM|nr:sensor histidine kinase [Colwellia demingiae]
MSPFRAVLNSYSQISKKQWFYWSLFYLFLGVVMALIEVADLESKEIAFITWEVWLDQFCWSICFGLITPFATCFFHRWSMEKGQRLTSTAKLILFYIPFKIIYMGVTGLTKQLLYWLITGSFISMETLLQHRIYQILDVNPILAYQVLDVSPLYLIAIFCVYTKLYFTTAQQEQIKSAQLEVELQKTRMDVLRNQLQPHFLFNTLNLISSTMYRDVDKADSIIARLGDLLRYSLATEQKPFVPLKEEIQVMTSYLEIAKLRFGDRLSTIINIAPETNDIMIPAMLLQPLLENAVKYGIEPSDEKGEVSLTTSLENSELIIEITNPWHQRRAQQESFGIGLTNTKNRLALLYSDHASVALETSNENQILLQIRLPVQQAQTLVSN